MFDPLYTKVKKVG